MTEVQSTIAEINLANNLAHLFRHASEITKETKGKVPKEEIMMMV